MDLFLKTLGVVFLVLIAGLLLFVVVAFLTIRAKIRRVTTGLKGLVEGLAEASRQPTTIALRRVVGIVWDDEDAVAALAGPLPELGFQEVGTFEVEGLPVRLWAWVHPGESLYAVVYEHPQAGTWMDFVTKYRDGTSRTYSNGRQGGALDQRTGHENIYYPDLGAIVLHRRALAERPDRPLRPLSAADFPGDFERAYAEEMDWRNSAGGPSERELRALAAASGEDYGDEIFAATRAIAERQATDGLEESLRRRFLEGVTLSAAEWEDVRDRLVIIHDKLTPERLAEIVEEWSDEDDIDPEALAPDGRSAREAFAAYNRVQPEASRFRKLGEVSEPIGADIYASPG